MNLSINNIFLKLFALLLLISSILFADINGTVFKDLPMNGQSLNSYGVKESNEFGIAGIKVTAYPQNISTTTDENGSWSLATTEDSRIEFSNIPPYLKESPNGGNMNSSIRFVKNRESLNFALHNPLDYIGVKPDIAMTFRANNSGADSTLFTVRVLRNGDIPSASISGVPQDGNSSNNGTQDKQPIKGDKVAFIDKTGSIWGLAFNRRTKDIYVSAVVVRYMNLGSDGTGAIYKIDSSNNVSLFTTVSNTGTIPSNASRNLSDDATKASHDILFDEVGRVGLGDLDISADGKKLYTININSNELVKIDIADPTVKNSYAIGNPFPNCPNSDVKSWGIGQNSGKIYVGSTCTTDVSEGVYISEFNGVSFTPFHQIKLDTTGETSVDMEHSYAGKSGKLSNDKRWRNWITNYSELFDMNKTRISYPAPILSDIIFDENKGMILGLIDRTSLQGGHDNYSPNSSDTTAYKYDSSGDILRVCKVNGSYFNEGTAECPQKPARTASDTEYVDFPEYFGGDEWNPHHGENALGGLAYQQGSNRVLSTAFDPVDLGYDGENNNHSSSGLEWLNTTEGNRTSGIRMAGGSDYPNMPFPYGGKAGGIGDVEYLNAPAPIEVGDRVWEDKNKNGVQDADEVGISGVTVNLVCNGSIVSTATTDGNGSYIFSNNSNKSSTSSHKYNITALVAEVNNCLIQVPNVKGGNKQVSLGDRNLTIPNIGEGENNNSNDSDGEINGDDAQIAILPSDISTMGTNYHAYDFGFKNNRVPTKGICWAIDDDTATLYKFYLDVNNTQTPQEIPISRKNEGEGLAYRASTKELYMWTDGKTYIMDENGTDIRSYDSNYADYVEGATFYIDPITKVEELWMTIEDKTTGDTKRHDRYLKQVNMDDGSIISSVKITGGFMDGSIDYGNDTGGLAIDPKTKQFWITDDSGARGFYKLDEKTGVVGDGKIITPNDHDLDLEGFSFADDGYFYSESDEAGIQYRRIWRLNINTGEYTAATEAFGTGGKGSYGDIEAIACNAGTTEAVSNNPIIDIEKATNGQDADDKNNSVVLNLGDTVTWSYVIKNIGDVKLEGISAIDDREGNITCPKTVLDINESMNCTDIIGTAQAGDYNNTAIVKSRAVGCIDTGCVDINDSDPSHYSVSTSISLGDFVWYDLDRDGEQDNNESGVEGVTVTLYKDCGTGAESNISKVVTDVNGSYIFRDLSEGDYCIEFSNIPNDYNITAKNQNANSAIDSDVNVATRRTDTIHPNLGENDMKWDMGIYPPAPRYSLGDKVWNDINRDGIQDSNESGVSGIKVTLYNNTNCQGDIKASTSTDINGLYSFKNLLNGNYCIVFSNLPKNYNISPNSGFDDGRDSDANGQGEIRSIKLTSDDLNEDMGIYLPSKSTPTKKFVLGNRAWLDSNRNGIQDSGEKGVGGITVNLYNNATCKGKAISTVETKESGEYLFNDLEQGIYCLEFINLPSWHTISPNTGEDDIKNSDANSGGRVENIKLERDDLDEAIGIYPTPPVPKKATIGDRVWLDSNRNGIQDKGEDGLKGVVVKLFRDCKSETNSTITNSRGFYFFRNIEPSKYCIEFELPDGYISTLRDEGSSDSKDSDVDINTHRTELTQLKEDEIDLSWDLGVYRRSSLGDFVWFDENKNGLQDNDEKGVKGVKVILYESDCTTSIAQTKADKSGHYLFENLRPNQYCIGFEDLPIGYQFTPNFEEGEDNTIDCDVDPGTGKTSIITLEYDERDLTWDMGIIPKCKDEEGRSLSVSDDSVEANTTGRVTRINILGNDSGNLDIESIKFVNIKEGETLWANGGVVGGTSLELLDKLVVEGEGVWSIDKDGTIIFTAEKGFEGTPSPVYYVVRCKQGTLSNIGQVKITTKCVCEDFEARGIPVLDNISILLLLLLTSISSYFLFMREEI
jgi:hypothetical protein